MTGNVESSWEPSSDTWTIQPPTRVLVAEDDPEMRRMIAWRLRRDGYEVLEADNGTELDRRLSSLGAYLPTGWHTDAPDLVISDVRMPGKTGLEILANIRAHNWSIPMVLITAFGDEETHREARRLGAAAVFDKPFDIRHLRDMVLDIWPP